MKFSGLEDSAVGSKYPGEEKDERSDVAIESNDRAALEKHRPTAWPTPFQPRNRPDNRMSPRIHNIGRFHDEMRLIFIGNHRLRVPQTHGQGKK